MDKGLIKLITFVLSLAVVFGAYMLMPKWHSRQVRKAAYERYSELGQPELVREIVDQNHDQIFEQCYKAGGRRTKANFDVDKYAELMDRKMEGIVDRMLTKAVGDAMKARSTATPPAAREATPAPAPVTAAALATPAPAATVSTPEAPSNAILNLAAKHLAYGSGGHQFLVEVDVSRSVPKRPESVRLSVDCPGGGQFIQERPELSPMQLSPTPPKEGWRMTFRVAVPDKVIGTSGGICSLEAIPRSGSGGLGEAKKIFIVAR